MEPVDADPRHFADDPNAPWPVKRGGWVLLVYEHSLGLAFVALAVYLRQRWSPESKPVHAAHHETGR